MGCGVAEGPRDLKHQRTAPYPREQVPAARSLRETGVDNESPAIVRLMRASLAFTVAFASSLALTQLACGGSAPPVETPPVQARFVPPPPSVTSPGTIRRAELDVVLGQGLGSFLSRVAVEPDVRDGHFVGFRLTELRDTELFANVDLQPGDTIVSVNGMAIERPEQAYEAWSSLRVASELTVDVMRETESRRLRYPITD